MKKAEGQEKIMQKLDYPERELILLLTLSDPIQQCFRRVRN